MIMITATIISIGSSHPLMVITVVWSCTVYLCVCLCVFCCCYSNGSYEWIRRFHADQLIICIHMPSGYLTSFSNAGNVVLIEFASQSDGRWFIWQRLTFRMRPYCLLLISGYVSVVVDSWSVIDCRLRARIAMPSTGSSLMAVVSLGYYGSCYSR